MSRDRSSPTDASTTARRSASSTSARTRCALVVYEGLTRSPTPLFNEKALCGLGREVQIDRTARGRRGGAGARRAQALTARCATRWASKRAARASRPPPAATPRTGADFIKLAERDLSAPRSTCSPAQREAELTALGVVSGFHRPDGIVGDLGGGSLELVDVHGSACGHGLTLPLGGLALQDISAKSLKKAEKYRQADARRVCRCSRRCEDRSLLRRRRHLARAGAAAHVADRLSAARDARLRDRRRRGAGILPAWCTASTSRRCPRSRWSPARAAAARLCGAGARAHRAHRQSRSRWCFPRSACAKGCSIRCSSRRTRRRTRCIDGGARAQPACARARRAMAKS